MTSTASWSLYVASECFFPSTPSSSKSGAESPFLRTTWDSITTMFCAICFVNKNSCLNRGQQLKSTRQSHSLRADSSVVECPPCTREVRGLNPHQSTYTDLLRISNVEM